MKRTIWFINIRIMKISSFLLNRTTTQAGAEVDGDQDFTFREEIEKYTITISLITESSKVGFTIHRRFMIRND